MKNYISYLRVSTKEQGNSGLGLQSQRETVNQFISSGNLIQEFQEIESGRNNSRPLLSKAKEKA
ncbi:recombinase family protein [Chryseobacterium sp.]|uniref:recombinase family protein n=1 Tax=Chryseobacterium sp. TaxID=1871047 RepID=UPI003916DA60